MTVQAAGAESLAVNRTEPPRPPTTCGAYSFGSPVAATARAMSGSLEYRAAPGQLVGPVSRCPEIARSFTSLPARYPGFPPDLQVSVLRRVDVGDVEAPRQQADERVQRRSGDPRRRVVADHGNTGGAGVEPLRVRADHVALDPAGTAFEDLAVLVDEEVVADVVPAVSADVVQLDPAHDRGGLAPGVGVRAGRVMDDRERRRERAYRGAPRVISSFAPHARRGTIRGVAGHGRRPERRPLDRAPHVPGAQPAHIARPRGRPRGRTRRPSRGCRAASRCGSSSPGCPGRAGPRPREPPAATSSSDRRRHACGRAPCRSPASGSRPGRRRTAPTRPRSCARRRPAGPSHTIVASSAALATAGATSASRAARKSALIRFRQCAHARRAARGR